MKSHAPLLASMVGLFMVGPVFADGASGRWTVEGNVEGKSFTLDCRFEQAAQSLSGSCTDGPTGDARVEGGRSHVLLEGRAAGADVSWTYESSYLFLKFDVKYTGIRDGDHMSGTISAAGKTGTFLANRLEP